MQGDRFRHAASFAVAARQAAADCRYDQLEVTTAYELEKVFGAHPRADRSVADDTSTRSRKARILRQAQDERSW
jgi:hypothetical protein